MKLRLGEFKEKVINGIESLIDTYFSEKNVSDRILNATVKIIVRQNSNKFDNLIELFADKDGLIDTDMIIAEYSKAFDADKLIIDIRDFVNNETVKQMLPNKALAIKMDDIAKMF